LKRHFPKAPAPADTSEKFTGNIVFNSKKTCRISPLLSLYKFTAARQTDPSDPGAMVEAAVTQAPSDPGAMVEAAVTQTYSIDSIHRNGTRILANILITPGNNSCSADVDLAFDSFCEGILSTLLVRQDA
jgi:hypothetical protein